MKVTSVEFVAGAASVESLPRTSIPEIAFLGPSNVGKSSLLNVLVGRKSIARVSKTPGRTQQLNIFLVNGSAHFVDLPGYGFAKAPRAVQDAFLLLVEDYLARSKNLRLLVLLLDSRRVPSGKDLELLAWLARERVPHAVVMTKADKLSQSEIASQRKILAGSLAAPPEGPRALVTFSAHSGLGKRELWTVIDDVLLGRALAQLD